MPLESLLTTVSVLGERDLMGSIAEGGMRIYVRSGRTRTKWGWNAEGGKAFISVLNYSSAKIH
jgi:hypothetical protein